MEIKFLNDCTSTNEVMKEMLKCAKINKPTAIVAQTQTSGRGQMGTKWQDESGKSLLISICHFPENLDVSDQFAISMAAALCTNKLLTDHFVQSTIKWPNDLLCNGKKISGILIENSLMGSAILSTTIGIGINLQQKAFPSELPATSVYLETGIILEPEDMAQKLLDIWREYSILLNSNLLGALKRQYLYNLLNFGSLAKYQTLDGKIFYGTIKDVLPDGRVVIENELGAAQTFQMKEIKLLENSH
jgi:BirA family transcriptional regulator, biotin operon repressor / biotin---[acetyl-CoA-carboxylase] ligase